MAADRPSRAGEVIFRAGEESNNSEIWDDTALIEAYDRAINSLKNGVGGKTRKKHNVKHRKQKNSNKWPNEDSRKNKERITNGQQMPKTEWQVGDVCSAVFTEDEMIYDAIILSIDEESSTCIVKYDGYGNKEEQFLADLMPPSKVDLPKYSTRVEGQHVANQPYESKSVSSMGHDMEWHSTSVLPLRWQVSDLCYAPEHPSGHMHQAVINSFPTPYSCKVTFTHSGQSQEVNLSSLQTSYEAKHSDYHSHTPFLGCVRNKPVHGLYQFSPGLPAMPPSAASQAAAFPSPLPPMASSSFPLFLHGSGLQNPTPMTKQYLSAPMPPPPAPVSSNDVEDDDALASMLMAWYLSGYHTGYYQAMQQHRQAATHKPTNIPCQDPKSEESTSGTSNQRS